MCWVCIFMGRYSCFSASIPVPDALSLVLWSEGFVSLSQVHMLEIIMLSVMVLGGRVLRKLLRSWEFRALMNKLVALWKGRSGIPSSFYEETIERLPSGEGHLQTCLLASDLGIQPPQINFFCLSAAQSVSYHCSRVHCYGEAEVDSLLSIIHLHEKTGLVSWWAQCKMKNRASCSKNDKDWRWRPQSIKLGMGSFTGLWISLIRDGVKICSFISLTHSFSSIDLASMLWLCDQC